MPATLDDLLTRAIDVADKSGTLADIKQAAETAKTLAEKRKALAEELKAVEDRDNSRRNQRFTHLQSIFTGTTAILSVLGLVATSIYNMAQVATTRQQAETTEWRDLLNRIDKPGVDAAQSPTIPFLLRSFAKSERYAADARLIGAGVLSKVTDVEAFKQLFNFIFPDQDANDIGTMVEIQTELFARFNKTRVKCEAKSENLPWPKTAAYKSFCWNAYSEKQLKDLGVQLTDTEMAGLRSDYDQQGDELTFMSAKIAEQLKLRRQSDTVIKLSGTSLQGSDLTGVDFHNIDISNTGFTDVVMKDVVLVPKRWNDATFVQADWWNAKLVDKDLLQWLIRYAYPPNSIHFFGNPPRPTRAEYLAAVFALCHKVELECSEKATPYQDDETGFTE